MKNRAILVGLGLWLAASTAWGKPEVFQDSSLAIRGYDPVAYFTESEPVKGSSQFRAEWHGATWQFSSDANRKLFVHAPEKYAPQYGGWCAYAIANDQKAMTIPEAWTIVNGKLYLNYSLDIQEKWRANQDDFIEKANANWPELKDS